MLNVGIIIEANPFHKGHKLLIDKVINDLHPDTLIAITSTYFSMRGDLSILNKTEKVNVLLNNGFDLVVELPTVLSLNRADLFSKYSIDILKNFNINYLAFGSENDDLDILYKSLDVINSKEFQEDFKNNKETSFKKLESIYLKDFPLNITSSNTTLARCYLNDIKDTNIKPYIIKRLTDYNSIDIDLEYPSANSLRLASYNNTNIDDIIKYNININYKLSIDNYMNLIKYNLLVLNKRNNNDIEGIGNYIVKNGNFNLNYFDFTKQLSNSKYTTTRIKRYLTELLIEKECFNYTNKYLRVLGFNNKGLLLINNLDKEIKNYIFSNPNDLKNNKELENYNDLISIYNNEEQYSKIYGYIIGNTNLYLEEYKFPIKK